MTAPSLPRRTDVRNRRVVQVVPAGTSSEVVVHLIRAAIDPDWRPSDASAVVIDHVAGDVALLRQARVRLLQCTRFRTTLAEARALATVNLAISSLEETRGTLRG